MKKSILIVVIFVCSIASAYAQPCLPEGIIFETQTQIDSFQINHPGCTEIEGNVIIQGMDIVNLNGLNVLTSIGGNLSIQETQISTFAGLDNLSYIGGDLSVGYYEYWGGCVTEIHH